MRILTTGILVTLCGCSVISSFDDYTVVDDAGMGADPNRRGEISVFDMGSTRTDDTEEK